jgi:hypothetical protein
MFQPMVRLRDLERDGSAQGQGTYDFHSARPKLPPAARLDLLAEIDARIRSRFPRVINADIIVNEFASERALVTSEGAVTYSFSPRGACHRSLGGRPRWGSSASLGAGRLRRDASQFTADDRSRGLIILARLCDERRDGSSAARLRLAHVGG